MQLRVGYELIYECPQPTPMMLMLNIHHTRASDIVIPDYLTTNPSLPLTFYRDAFGNWCTRIVAPPGRTRLSANAVINDSGVAEPVERSDRQHAVEDLPDECLQFLLGSRYCETDRLSDVAWSLFERSRGGAQRVQAICDFVHQHITFGYENARSTRTAWEAFSERKGVCRDFAHLAVAFCRCMNIPARYCTGYLGDVGMPPPYGPMDFAAWFEAFVDGHWHTFDPRNNIPRIGRVLMARGRDATDVAISNAFGPNTLVGFKVWTDEVSGISERRTS
jgi:transglutaminase-like putative cysteine protease